MKYIAFSKSVAQMAATFIANHAIVNKVKIAVEVSTPNAVELISSVGDKEMTFLLPLLEKFQGQLTDEIPSPVNFLNKLPRTRRPKGNDYDFTTRGERDRRYDRHAA